MKKSTYSVISKNKKKGLELFYKRYGKNLLNYGISKWKIDEDTAWELLYNCFEKIHKSIDKKEFENEKKFGNYVFTSFLNLIRNHIRDQKKNIEIDKNEKLENISNFEEEESIESVDMVLLKQELDRLKDWERMLLLMRAQKMTFSEISKYVDKPADQLRVYNQRLRKKIMQNINSKKEVSNEK